jgi:hypothetical protein
MQDAPLLQAFGPVGKTSSLCRMKNLTKLLNRKEEGNMKKVIGITSSGSKSLAVVVPKNSSIKSMPVAILLVCQFLFYVGYIKYEELLDKENLTITCCLKKVQYAYWLAPTTVQWRSLIITADYGLKESKV